MLLLIFRTQGYTGKIDLAYHKTDHRMFENDPKGYRTIVIEILNLIISQNVLSVTVGQIAKLLVYTQTLGGIVKINVTAINGCAILKLDAKVKPYLHIFEQVGN